MWWGNRAARNTKPTLARPYDPFIRLLTMHTSAIVLRETTVMYRFPISQSLPHISIDFPPKVACIMAFAPHRDSYIMSDCLIISEPSDTRAGSVFYRYLALFLFLSQMNGTTRSERDSGYWDTPATDKPTGTHRYIWRTRRYRSAVEPLLAETTVDIFLPFVTFFFLFSMITIDECR